MIMAMITQAFRYAYEPFVFGSNKDRNSAEMQAKVMNYFILCTLFAFMAVVAYLPILKYIIKSDYWEGLRVVPIVMMAEIFMGIYFNLSFWYKLTDQTWWGAIFSAIGCIVLLAINIIFVPQVGYMACAWGGFAGYGVCMILSYLVGRKKNPIPYDLKSALFYIVITLILYTAIAYLPEFNLIITLVLNTVILLLFVAAVAWKEKELVRGIATTFKQKILKK